MALVVKYMTGGRARKTGIPLRLVETPDQLEEILRTKTALQVEVSNPWWLRLSRALGTEPRWEEPGAWRRHLLYPLRGFAIAMLVMLIGFACIIAFDYFWPEAPAWPVIIVAAGVPLATYLLILRRRKHKTAQGGDPNVPT